MFGPSLENRCYGSIPNMSHTVHLPVARSSPGHHEPVGADQGPPADQGASVWRLRLWHASADVEDGIVPGGHVHCQSSVGLAVLEAGLFFKKRKPNNLHYWEEGRGYLEQFCFVNVLHIFPTITKILSP